MKRVQWGQFSFNSFLNHKNVRLHRFMSWRTMQINFSHPYLLRWMLSLPNENIQLILMSKSTLRVVLILHNIKKYIQEDLLRDQEPIIQSIISKNTNDLTLTNTLFTEIQFPQKCFRWIFTESLFTLLKGTFLERTWCTFPIKLDELFYYREMSLLSFLFLSF